MNKIKEYVFYFITEYLFLFILGGSIYYGIEILYRGFSHPAMIAVGGLCFICIGLLNEIFPWDMPFWHQIIIGDIIVLYIEFISGLFLNVWLKLNIWDYSDLPFNLFGQICLSFALLWLPVIAFAIITDDISRWKWFHGEKPRYNFKLK